MGDSSDITTKPIEATRHYTVVHVMHSTSSIHWLVSTNTAHVVNIKWFTYIQYCAASPRCVDWFGTTLWNELNWITDGCELHNFTHYFSCSHLPLLLHFIHQGRWFRVCMWFVNHSTYARLSGESWSGNLSLGDLKQTRDPLFISACPPPTPHLHHSTRQCNTKLCHTIKLLMVIPDGPMEQQSGGAQVSSEPNSACWSAAGGVLTIWCLSLGNVVILFQHCGCRRQFWTLIGWWDTRRRWHMKIRHKSTHLTTSASHFF